MVETQVVKFNIEDAAKALAWMESIVIPTVPSIKDSDIRSRVMALSREIDHTIADAIFNVKRKGV